MSQSFLFVCLGNICRSPMAMMLARHHDTTGALFDSAGTHAGDRREGIDPRAAAELQRHGIAVLSKSRSRRIQPADFERFDHIVAMDQSNLVHLRAACPTVHLTKLSLLLDWSDGPTGREVPDPYFGGPDGFRIVFDLCKEGLDGIIRRSSQAQGPQIDRSRA